LKQEEDLKAKKDAEGSDSDLSDTSDIRTKRQ
jgi:hypothetical protein